MGFGRDLAEAWGPWRGLADSGLEVPSPDPRPCGLDVEPVDDQGVQDERPGRRRFRPIVTGLYALALRALHLERQSGGHGLGGTRGHGPDAAAGFFANLGQPVVLQEGEKGQQHENRAGQHGRRKGTGPANHAPILPPARGRHGGRWPDLTNFTRSLHGADDVPRQMHVEDG